MALPAISFGGNKMERIQVIEMMLKAINLQITDVETQVKLRRTSLRLNSEQLAALIKLREHYTAEYNEITKPAPTKKAPAKKAAPKAVDTDG